MNEPFQSFIALIQFLAILAVVIGIPVAWLLWPTRQGKPPEPSSQWTPEEMEDMRRRFEKLCEECDQWNAGNPVGGLYRIQTPGGIRRQIKLVEPARIRWNQIVAEFRYSDGSLLTAWVKAVSREE